MVFMFILHYMHIYENRIDTDYIGVYAVYVVIGVYRRRGYMFNTVNG